MPPKHGHSSVKPEISVALGIGVGVAAVAGLAAAGAVGVAGMLAVGVAAHSGLRNSKPSLRPEDVKWDSEGRIENWTQALKIMQQGVSSK
jgi:hypothetical protein